MRYLIQKEFQNEIPARISYLKDCFGIWMYAGTPEGEFVPLISMPDTFHSDVLFLLGHNIAVNRYLSEHSESMTEQYIVLITCQRGYRFERYAGKNRRIYIARQEERTAKSYHREDYEFDFDPYNSELICYNLKQGSLVEKIERAFVRMA